MTKRMERIKTATSKSSQRIAKPSKSQKHVIRGNKSASSMNPDRVKEKGNWRDKSTIKRLKMYKDKPDVEKMKEQSTKPARIAPDRRWFGNTRVIATSKVEQFRESLENLKKDPYSVIVKKTKLPVSLFDHSNEQVNKRMNNLLQIESYKDVIDGSRGRKRPRIEVSQLSDMVAKAKEQEDVYVTEKQEVDRDIVVENLIQAKHGDDVGKDRDAECEAVFRKGTSKRIWGELYKVIDSSDVIIQVLDARDPLGTRCMHIEKQIREEKKNKHLVFVLNKCDLIPTWVKERWIKALSKVAPTVAFKSSIQHPFGKKALVSLLTQFAQLLKHRKTISVGFIGYPNVGKSSVINTIKGKDVCNTAPVPGETKVWQYISLTSKVYLIDCPGVVASSSGDDDTAKVLKGVVRAEKAEHPEQYISAILELVTEEKIRKKYNIDPAFSWKTADEFLEYMAVHRGRLTKGGNADVGVTARGIIYDFQRGKLPYYRTPKGGIPKTDASGEVEVDAGDDEGLLKEIEGPENEEPEETEEEEEETEEPEETEDPEETDGAASEEEDE